MWAQCLISYSENLIKYQVEYSRIFASKIDFWPRLSASGGSPTVASGLAGSQGPSSPTLPPGKDRVKVEND